MLEVTQLFRHSKFATPRPAVFHDVRYLPHPLVLALCENLQEDFETDRPEF